MARRTIGKNSRSVRRRGGTASPRVSCPKGTARTCHSEHTPEWGTVEWCSPCRPIVRSAPTRSYAGEYAGGCCGYGGFATIGSMPASVGLPVDAVRNVARRGRLPARPSRSERYPCPKGTIEVCYDPGGPGEFCDCVADRSARPARPSLRRARRGRPSTLSTAIAATRGSRQRRGGGASGIYLAGDYNCPQGCSEICTGGTLNICKCGCV